MTTTTLGLSFMIIPSMIFPSMIFMRCREDNELVGEELLPDSGRPIPGRFERADKRPGIRTPQSQAERYARGLDALDAKSSLREELQPSSPGVEMQMRTIK